MRFLLPIFSATLAFAINEAFEGRPCCQKWITQCKLEGAVGCMLADYNYCVVPSSTCQEQCNGFFGRNGRSTHGRDTEYVYQIHK
ncbi:hypothetical protein IAQ61_004970 [Plenodomus lingam]|uniref:uncharacterized protein n=1 Tax=Leptosphaeria maculans TaxID=5022 RepID=UPI00331A5FDB|nr:hypothetical protein IAQ61_004970 [Plenodomus lingam]